MNSTYHRGNNIWLYTTIIKFKLLCPRKVIEVQRCNVPYLMSFQSLSNTWISQVIWVGQHYSLNHCWQVYLCLSIPFAQFCRDLDTIDFCYVFTCSLIFCLIPAIHQTWGQEKWIPLAYACNSVNIYLTSNKENKPNDIWTWIFVVWRNQYC